MKLRRLINWTSNQSKVKKKQGWKLKTHQFEKSPRMTCWLGLQQSGPSYRQSRPPQANRQMILEGRAFTRTSLVVEYEGVGTEISDFMKIQSEDGDLNSTNLLS